MRSIAESTIPAEWDDSRCQWPIGQLGASSDEAVIYVALRGEDVQYGSSEKVTTTTSSAPAKTEQDHLNRTTESDLRQYQALARNEDPKNIIACQQWDTRQWIDTKRHETEIEALS